MFPVLALLKNPIVRNLLIFAVIALAVWAGWSYVQGLREDKAQLEAEKAALTAQVENLDNVNKAKEQAFQAERVAREKFEKLYGKVAAEFTAWKRRHAISIQDLVQVDPKRAEQLLFDEYRYRLKCLEMLTGKMPPPEELEIVKTFCEVAK